MNPFDFLWQLAGWFLLLPDRDLSPSHEYSGRRIGSYGCLLGFQRSSGRAWVVGLWNPRRNGHPTGSRASHKGRDGVSIKKQQVKRTDGLVRRSRSRCLRWTGMITKEKKKRKRNLKLFVYKRRIQIWSLSLSLWSLSLCSFTSFFVLFFQTSLWFIYTYTYLCLSIDIFFRCFFNECNYVYHSSTIKKIK